MASDDIRKAQRDALVALQQLRTQTPSLASLQAQLMQGMLPRTELDAAGGNLAPAAGEQYLVFTLADHEFAVKAEMVQGVERMGDCTFVPNVVSWVKGVINLRGSIVSVIDLRMFLELESLPSSSRTRLLSLQYNEMVICFVVDGVSEMLPIPAASIISGNSRQASIPPWATPYAAGSAFLGNRMLALLDVPRLLFSEKIQHYGAL